MRPKTLKSSPVSHSQNLSLNKLYAFREKRWFLYFHFKKQLPEGNRLCYPSFSQSGGNQHLHPRVIWSFYTPSAIQSCSPLLLLLHEPRWRFSEGHKGWPDDSVGNEQAAGLTDWFPQRDRWKERTGCFKFQHATWVHLWVHIYTHKKRIRSNKKNLESN